jgi:hypothetical protein
MHDALENLDYRHQLDFETCLFECLTANAVRQFLAHFEHASGQRPVAFQWLASAFD